MATPEGKVKQRITKALDRVGAYYNANAVGMFGSKGHPDLSALYNGVTMYIEVKATKHDKPRESQLQRLHHIVRQGGIALVLHSENVLEFEVFVDAITVGDTPTWRSIASKHAAEVLEAYDSVECVVI